MTAALFVAASYFCAQDDLQCWQKAALEQEERAERAEHQAELLRSARKITDRLIADEQARGDRWRQTAERLAPRQPAWHENPVFWAVVGFVSGAAVTVSVVYGVVPAFKK